MECVECLRITRSRKRLKASGQFSVGEGQRGQEMSIDEKQDANDVEKRNADDRVAVKAFVDRIEEDIAVILFSDGGGQFDAPIRYLPPGTKAGDHLVIYFQLDPESRAATLRN